VDHLCANQVMCVASLGGIQIISATTPFLGGRCNQQTSGLASTIFISIFLDFLA
jgi:hypothetical protein